MESYNHPTSLGLVLFPPNATTERKTAIVFPIGNISSPPKEAYVRQISTANDNRFGFAEGPISGVAIKSMKI